MPRQDVPYGGAICRLKERIAEIWDKLGEKLHSVNGVTGDAAGDVKIVSGDAAITISEDQVNHTIEIALDSSQLPAASVSSVNGQTGAVALDAGDINVVGGSNVQDELDDLDADVQQVQTDIAQEALTRANADSALQTNINAALASIPEMSVTPDPYKGVERDAQGRAFAADPASGAVDQTLVTANWASQTGAGRPNNLLHDSGVESISTIKEGIVRKSVFMRVATSQEQSQNLHWFKILDIQQNFKLKMEAYSRYGYWHVIIAGSNTLQTNAVISKVGQWANLSNKLKACLNSTTGRWEIWLDSPSGNTGGGLTIDVEADPMAGSTTDANYAVLNVNATAEAEPILGSTYTVVNVII